MLANPRRFRWSLPEGITAGDIHWPIPERIPYLDLMNFGYHGKVLLLTELHIDPDFTGPADIDLNADSTWLVCKEVCIMEDGTFTLPVRIEADPPPRNTAAGAAIAATRAALPQDAPWPIKVSRNGDVVTFTARTDLKGSEVTEAIFFPHIDGVIENAAPQDVRLSDGELKIATTTGYDADNIAEISGLLVFTRQCRRWGVRSGGIHLQLANHLDQPRHRRHHKRPPHWPRDSVRLPRWHHSERHALRTAGSGHEGPEFYGAFNHRCRRLTARPAWLTPRA